MDQREWPEIRRTQDGNIDFGFYKRHARELRREEAHRSIAFLAALVTGHLRKSASPGNAALTS